MIEGIDYCFIYPKNDKESVNVKLLDGDYKDTIFKYGRVKFEEKNDEMHLLFAYDVLESPIEKPRKLEKNEDFKNHIGNLLVELMSANIETEIVDETGTSDTDTPDLQ